jgi:hypothetical protein
MFYAGAGLSQPVWDSLAASAERAVGERIRDLHRPGHDRDGAGLHCSRTGPTSARATSDCLARASN